MTLSHRRPKPASTDIVTSEANGTPIYLLAPTGIGPDDLIVAIVTRVAEAIASDSEVPPKPTGRGAAAITARWSAALRLRVRVRTDLMTDLVSVLQPGHTAEVVEPGWAVIPQQLWESILTAVERDDTDGGPANGRNP